MSSVMTRKETAGTSTFLPGEVAIAAGMDVGAVQVGCEGRKVGRWEMGHNIRTRRVAIDHVINDVAFTGGRERGGHLSVGLCTRIAPLRDVYLPFGDEMARSRDE